MSAVPGAKARRRGWLASVYRAGEAEGRIGQRSASIDALLAAWRLRRGSFLTAWNPWGKAGGAARNARRAARLAGETRRLPRAAGDCGTDRWQERTLFLGADPRRVAVLARTHRQAAVVHAARGRPLWLAEAPRFAAPAPCMFSRQPWAWTTRTRAGPGRG
jgi:hypothetical protein